jgi:methylmalonyl-CoA mutase cobalamin-binding domain/chain
MTKNTALLKDVENVVFIPEEKRLDNAIDAAVAEGFTGPVIRQSLLNGLDRVRKKLLSNESSLPELLVSLDITACGIKMLSGKCTDISTGENPVSLVIGVVAGDPHDLGKNIISLIYDSFGYRVTDLGAQVEKETFVKMVKAENARVLALSAMMSTTMSLMPEIIKDVKKVSPETLVIVGGAPFDEILARSYGADGYAQSAVTVLEQTQKMIAHAKGSI